MDRLGVFAKYWEPGQVKSRLGREIGMEAASQIYRGFLECILQRWSGTGATRDLVVWPAAKQTDFSELISGSRGAEVTSRWNCVAQSGDDLGQRLSHYTRESFANGTQRLLVLGTDSPDLPRQVVASAWQSLEDHDVVLGPAEDGGYYLIGLSGPHLSAFRNIPWSSPLTLEVTLAAVEWAGLSVQLLPAWYDVDDLMSLERLISLLGSSDHRGKTFPDRLDSTPFATLLERIQRWYPPPAP